MPRRPAQHLRIRRGNLLTALRIRTHRRIPGDRSHDFCRQPDNVVSASPAVTNWPAIGDSRIPCPGIDERPAAYSLAVHGERTVDAEPARIEVVLRLRLGRIHLAALLRLKTGLALADFPVVSGHRRQAMRRSYSAPQAPADHGRGFSLRSVGKLTPHRPVTGDSLQGMTPPEDLTGLLTWHVLALIAIGLISFLAGRLSAWSQLRDAQVIAEVNARFDTHTAEALALLRQPFTTAPRQDAPTVRTAAAARPARARFERAPRDFPLLHLNPLTVLLTQPKVEPQTRKFTDRFLLITLRAGRIHGAAFMPS